LVELRQTSCKNIISLPFIVGFEERGVFMKNNFQLAVLLLVALAMFAFTLYWFRAAPNNLTRVTVSGEAQSRVAPDTAVVTLSVVTQNAQAINAQQDNARKSEAVISAIKAVAATAELKTGDYNLQPEQDYGGKMPKIVGYTARNSVTASVSDLNIVGAVIDAATKAGANSVEGVQFVVRQDSPAHGAALALATRQAMAKAESIAASLDGRIVRIIESHEGGFPIRQSAPDYNYGAMNSNMSMSSAKPPSITPVEAGSLNVRSQVALIAEIEIKR
jgi:uncharacterized protein YggE